jgi:hypothetical protein
MGTRERETMGRHMLNSVSFIDAASDTVTIHFPRKGDFCFNHPHNPDVDSRGQKGGSLKAFKV